LSKNDIARVEAHREAEQIAKNKREFDFIETHHKVLKTTIEGLGKITSMDCIVKICANVCCVITAFFNIRPGNPVRWHAEARGDVPQLPYIFLNMLHKVLTQLAVFSTNAVNNNLVEHGDNGSKLVVTPVTNIVKFASRFFDKMDNHILEGSVPDSVPNFTPRDANPKHQAMSVTAATIGTTTVSNGAGKLKPKALPPETPARERTSNKQKLKPAAGARDFTKAGLFCCKEGTPILELFPADLSKKYCSFFCFHDKKCTKPNQACDFDHTGRWDKIPVDDQANILAHCHATHGAKVWLNAETFTKHKATVPDDFVYLLGDAKGAKRV
jgi:hypothetical protein